MKLKITNILHSAGFLPLILSIIIFDGCKKLVDIPQPAKTITTAKTFEKDANAASAVVAIYSNMSYANGGNQFSSGLLTMDAGLSADELRLFGSLTNKFYINNLKNDDAYGPFWQAAYYNIYSCNAVLEGLAASPSITSSVKSILIGEAKFLRAFNYFYLTNLFGDVPLVNTTDFAKNSLLARSPVNDVYQQMVSDLKDAQNLLASDYTFTNGQRIRATKWAATALLARVYLYTGDWTDAESQASAIINNSSLFSLNSLKNVFSSASNNNEPILQLQCINNSSFGNATQEGNTFIPPNPRNSSEPIYILTPQLLSAFETGDQRLVVWADTTNISGTRYYFPYKFKVRQISPGDIYEYNTPLRLAEQYLIRAEARAKQNHLDIAINDLNTIRTRAGLAPLSTSLGQSQVLAAVAQENRIEFFAEWGHRWFDLKRTGQVDAVLGSLKGSTYWQTTDQLWPIPLSERLIDPNLTQNPGYN